jgi:uncharacterized membrane protein YccF (DUF307 family)
MISSMILIGSLVIMHNQKVSSISSSISNHDCNSDCENYNRLVMDSPDDHSGVVEETVMTGLVTVSTNARTLYSKDVCPFCEIHRRKTKHPIEHCFTCGICVDGLDHHCPWTGTCVGEHNIWTFRIFLIATLSTVISYVRLYSASRTPFCNGSIYNRETSSAEEIGDDVRDGDSGSTSMKEVIWCILSGPLLHSIILLTFYLPLFLFAIAITVTQCRLYMIGLTMVGRSRKENELHVRKMKLCGGGR